MKYFLIFVGLFFGIMLYLASLDGAWAQYKVEIIQNGEVRFAPQFKNKSDLDKNYLSNAPKGDFGANEKTKSFDEGEEVESGFESCEQIEIELPSDGTILGDVSSAVGLGDTKLINRCVYAPKYSVKYFSKKDKAYKTVDPRGFDLTDVDVDDKLKKSKGKLDADQIELAKLKGKLKNKSLSLVEIQELLLLHGIN